jgi:hypothetical protein
VRSASYNMELCAIDAYRPYPGAVICGGKHIIISNALGADMYYKSYQYRVTQLLHPADAAFTGGMNKMVLNGQFVYRKPPCHDLAGLHPSYTRTGLAGSS